MPTGGFPTVISLIPDSVWVIAHILFAIVSGRFIFNLFISECETCLRKIRFDARESPECFGLSAYQLTHLN